MRKFTDEEYEILIHETAEREPKKYDMLCHIATISLEKAVKRWCDNDPILAGRQLEGDVMNDIHYRLIKTCVTRFLKRDDRNGEINRNPDEFYAWMFTVAFNVKRDFARKERQFSFHTTELDDNIPYYGAFRFIEDASAISQAFSVAISAHRKPYIILTWMIQSLITIHTSLTKIEATELMVGMLEDKTLFDVWRLTASYLRMTPWIELTRDQKEHFAEKLYKKDADGSPMGDIIYSDCYMEKGGKATISDWVNRINDLIKSQMNYDPFND